jgi:hypothetical protein
MSEKPAAPTDPFLSRTDGAIESKPAGCDGRLCASASSALALLEQAAAFIETLDDESYSRPSRIMSGGTIGKHFRHVVDHFAATLAPIAGDGPECVIEYDRRARNVPMETSRDAALGEIRGVMRALQLAHENGSGRSVRVRVMLTSDGAEREFASTLGREIAFASHHAVHHHAMIAVIAGELGVPAPAGFGKAPATLNHEQSGAGRPR